MPPTRSPGGFSRRQGSDSVRVAILAVSLLAIVGAVVGVQYSSGRSVVAPRRLASANSPAVELVDCLVAVDKIEPGAPLDPTKFKRETKPVMTTGAKVVTSFEKLRGAYASSFIAAGQPLLEDYLTNKAPVNEIQANIPEGFRAVAVAVDDVSNVEGWVRAAAKVDVMLASEVNGKPAITLLAQNAKVLSTGKVGGDGKTGNSKKGGSTTITIMVTVDEATKIQLASTSGVMSLALRGDEDTVETADNQTVTLDTVFGVAMPQAEPGPQREGRITVGGRSYQIIGGKLVAEDSTQPENKK